jgi:hypothetical protein
MTQRQRIEDLGVLSEKLHNLSEDELFEVIDKVCRRCKDFTDVFQTLSEDRKEEILDEIAYGIERVKEKIVECYFVALGEEEDDDDDRELVWRG